VADELVVAECLSARLKDAVLLRLLNVLELFGQSLKG
jgi:hypothetical protein